MYHLIFGIITVGLAGCVSAQSQRRDILWPVGSRDLLAGHLKDVVAERAAPIMARQSIPDPPTTNVAQCDTYDGYFYVTPRNYTWQLQCTTNYEGTLIASQDAANYSACIFECVDYNRMNGAGACLAISFNGPNDGALGLCQLWASVDNVLQAYPEGNVQDSALLVRSPDGTIYATPRADPSFSGQASIPPTVVPVPPTSTQSTTTVFSTSVVFVTSCPPGVSCPALSSTTTANPLPPASTTPHLSITNGGPRPISATTPSQTPLPTFPPSTGVGGQTTFTTVKPYTEYIVEVVTVCAAATGPCTVITGTSTLVGYRTQLSCTPGVCTGAMVNNQVDAQFTAATCIATS